MYLVSQMHVHYIVSVERPAMLGRAPLTYERNYKN